MVELRDSSLAHGLVIAWFLSIASTGSWFMASAIAKKANVLSQFAAVSAKALTPR
jgi:hypothetical protein